LGTLANAVLLVLAPLSVTAAPDPGFSTLDAVTVTATKREQPVRDVPATVTVIDREQLDALIANDIKDALRYEPGVSVRNQGTRFGLSGFNIRGLEGNRVLIEVDGIRQPDAFAIGDFSNATRDGVDLDLIKRVEIVRGAASSLYGSSAMGGVVSFQTRDAADFLAPGGTFGGEFKLATEGASDSVQVLGVLATRGSVVDGLLALSTTSGSEIDNQGENTSRNSSRTLPNPQDFERHAVLAKIGANLEDGARLGVTFEVSDRQVATNVLSAVRGVQSGPSRIDTLSLLGDDGLERQRISVDFESGSAFGFDRWFGLLYRQRGLTTQDSLERRDTISGSGIVTAKAERERRFEFEQVSSGVELTGHRAFEWGSSKHYLVAGLDAQTQDTTQSRDGLQRNLRTGAVTPVVGPDAFPVRDFPLSEEVEVAIYVQEEISWNDDRVRLLPGVRMDHFRLDSSSDPVFAADNPGVEIVDLNETNISPKLGASFAISDVWSLHGQYAHGFRSPPYADVNIGFTNLAFGYTAIANPDLKPETSDSFEAGLRWRSGDSAAAFTIFENRYRDFIESFVAVGTDPSGLLVFQSQNLARVRISGAELRAEIGLGSGLSLRCSAAYQRGTNEATDAPLDSIDPVRAVLGLRWTALDERLVLELIGSGARRKDRIETSLTTPFQSPGFAVLDLLASYKPHPQWTLRAGVFNVADRTYWEWSDVRGRAASDPAIDRYTAPARSVNASVSYAF
jgi:hemoglobin/transferrin/lactoferrin receptor protein